MRLPNLNALRMFDAAARHLNFASAAAELHLTQGAVAQQVRKLEADLGLALFTRHARGLTLTEAGRSYQGPIRRALAQIEAATAQLKPTQSKITLSVTPSLATKWLVPRLMDFAKTHPEIDLNLQAGESLANFRTDGVDLAIRQTRPPFAPNLTTTRLAPITLCAVAAPSLYRATAQVTDLAHHPMISDAHHYWEDLMAAHQLPPPIRLLQFNQTALAMDASANGQGVALAPALLVADDVAKGRLEVLWQDTRTDDRGFYLVHPKAAKSNPAREAVKRWLIAQIAA